MGWRLMDTWTSRSGWSAREPIVDLWRVECSYDGFYSRPALVSGCWIYWSTMCDWRSSQLTGWQRSPAVSRGPGQIRAVPHRRVQHRNRRSADGRDGVQAFIKKKRPNRARFNAKHGQPQVPAVTQTVGGHSMHAQVAGPQRDATQTAQLVPSSQGREVA
jgi:hypothetical protein